MVGVLPASWGEQAEDTPGTASKADVIDGTHLARAQIRKGLRQISTWIHCVTIKRRAVTRERGLWRRTRLLRQHGSHHPSKRISGILVSIVPIGTVSDNVQDLIAQQAWPIGLWSRSCDV